MAATFSTLFVEPVGGVAGDMLLAACIDAGADASAIRTQLQSLGLPGLTLEVTRVKIGGGQAAYVKSLHPAETPHHHHPHDHTHAEGHSHAAHRLLAEVGALIDRGAFSSRVKEAAKSVYQLLGKAEAHVHDATLESVMLHEVGALDSVLDVVGICVALELLGWPKIVTGVLPMGSGFVDTSHGRLAVPVPVVQEMLDKYGIPSEKTTLVGETVTPTGLAVLASLGSFGEKPAGLNVVGIGAGTRRYPNRPNIVRLYG